MTANELVLCAHNLIGTPYVWGGYYNMYVHSRKNYWNNFTHNGILYVIGDGE